ncbi:MAG: tail fiber domain-containing protein [Acidobacteriota bacterium]
MKQATRIAAVLVAASLLAIPATAAPYFESLALGNGVGFNTDFAYGAAYVKVTGPNDYSQEVALTEADVLSLAFADDLADGLYKWRVTMVQPISADVRAAMAEARSLQKPARFDIESHTFTGSFRVTGGAVTEPSPGSLLDDRDVALKDQVFLDDLIVSGSACAGLDCNNGESFGFDTLRLKENNLRIHFNDTSNTASFPSTDWRLVANDTGNGGTNHFSIEDSTVGRSPFRVEGGAPSNTLVVEADGDVGVKTLDPAVDIHVVEGNTPTLRLEQDGSDGFTPQTYDVAANEANFFIRDVTNGSRLFFRARPGAPESSIDIQGNGNVGMGTTSAQAPLHVRTGGTNQAPSNSSTVAIFQSDGGSILSLLAGSGTSNAQIFFGDTTGDSVGRIIYRNGADTMSFRVNADTNDALTILANGDLSTASGATMTGGAWMDASSRALKQDIEQLGAEDALAAFAELNPVSYRYKRNTDEQVLGFIAEDVPELVATTSRKNLSSMDIVALLTKVMQEQQKTVESQQQTIDALTQRLEALENVE